MADNGRMTTPKENPMSDDRAIATDATRTPRHVVAQSAAIHPTWTVLDHINYLDNEYPHENWRSLYRRTALRPSQTFAMIQEWLDADKGVTTVRPDRECAALHTPAAVDLQRVATHGSPVERLGAYLIDALPRYGAPFVLAPQPPNPGGWHDEDPTYPGVDSRVREKDAYLTGLSVAASIVAVNDDAPVDACIAAALDLARIYGDTRLARVASGVQ